MAADSIEIKADEDGCIYVFNIATESWSKISDIPSFNDLPLSVQRQIKAAKEEAVEIMQLPSA